MKTSRPHAIIRSVPRDEGPRATLTAHEVLQLRVATMCDEKTVKRWAAGRTVRAATMHRLSMGAAKLGIEVRA